MTGWQTDPLSIATYSRTYAQSVAGIPTKMKYDAKSLRFELCYTVNPDIDQPTVIYVNNQIHYVNGLNVRVEGGAARGLVVDVSATELNTVTVSFDQKLKHTLSSYDACVHINSK